MKILLITISLSCLLCSCNNQSFIQGDFHAKDTIDMKNITINDEPILLSDFINQIIYYPIPTERDFLIGDISKMVVTDSIFFLVDNQICHSVFIISKDYESISKIHYHGNGPTEYLQINDAFYDKRNDEVGIYCNLSNKIYYYYTNGEFVRIHEIPYDGEMAQPINNNIIIHTTYKENHQLKKKNMFPNLIQINPKNISNPQCCNYFKESVRRDIVWCSNSWFCTWDDTICIKPDHGNIVYHCTNNDLYPAHYLDFGRNNIDERYWEQATQNNMTIEKLEEFCRMENLCEIIWYLENEKFIYFTCKQEGKLYQVLFSKRTKKTHIITKTINDIDMYAKFQPKAILGNKLYGIIPAYDVVQLRNIVLAADTPERLLTVEEGDNPIIIEFTLKDF